MSGGNFAQLKLDKKGKIAPWGPLFLKAGEKMVRLYVWVYQLKTDGSGASCVAFQENFPLAAPFPGKGTWTTINDTAVYDGTFELGPITAMAMAVSTGPKGENKTYWWTETMMLVEGGDGDADPWQDGDDAPESAKG